PIIGWSPSGDPHLHGRFPNPRDGLEEALRRAAHEGDPSQEIPKLAAQLGQILQVPGIAEWVDGLFRPDPTILVTIDILFPPFTTYVPQPDGGVRKVVGQWFD